VYTPPGHRGRGAASALVHHRSAAIRADGHQALLFTELENPTSNAIYQAIGYRAVAEITRYELDAAS
jgi:predicted GNAT family acetyltransferase